MFRRNRTAPTTTGDRRAARHTRRAHDEQTAAAAALQARLDRAQRRLAQVGCVAGPVRPEAIDTASARRDPMTHPFPVVFGGAPAPRRERITADRWALASR